jgi:hypothetical protein
MYPGLYKVGASMNAFPEEDAFEYKKNRSNGAVLL